MAYFLSNFYKPSANFVLGMCQSRSVFIQTTKKRESLTHFSEMVLLGFSCDIGTAANELPFDLITAAVSLYSSHRFHAVAKSETSMAHLY